MAHNSAQLLSFIIIYSLITCCSPRQNSTNLTSTRRDNATNVRQISQATSSQVSSPYDIEKWVNYLRLIDYSSTSSCHHNVLMPTLVRKINTHLVINGEEWNRWNVISGCATYYSISQNVTSQPSHLLTAHCACACDVHIPSCSPIQKCRQVYAKVQVQSAQVHHPVGCVYASLHSTRRNMTKH